MNTIIAGFTLFTFTAKVMKYVLSIFTFAPMKKLLVALTLLFTSILPISVASAAPTDDLVFDRLDQWATDLQKQAMNWNSNCAKYGRNHDSGGCQRSLEALQAQQKQFVQLAGEYHSNGTDCRAILRQRWIQFRIRQFTFDLKYAGIRDTARQSEEFGLNRQMSELREELKKCTGK